MDGFVNKGLIMDEFNNRIAAQREILIIINSKKWNEELFGLSTGSIDRWLNLNNINHISKISILLKDAAEKLFFLANKSQEQITNDYKLLSQEVSSITEKISQEMNIINQVKN